MKVRENIAGSLVLAILTILVLLPLVTVLLQVICPGLKPGELDMGNMSLVMDVFVRPLWKKAFINSASMSLCTTVLGLCLAGILAHIRVKYDFPLAKLLDVVSWILMIMPSFILAQGWVFFASGNGIARSWLHIEGMNNFLFSFPGLVTVMVLCKYPMAYVAIKAALEWYPAVSYTHLPRLKLLFLPGRAGVLPHRLAAGGHGERGISVFLLRVRLSHGVRLPHGAFHLRMALPLRAGAGPALQNSPV